ncbi:MAG: hypothetical protein U9Q29_07550 [Campylobacterota bacterium]|nr:hypothetical protein [Campylobacterota bacterium]
MALKCLKQGFSWFFRTDYLDIRDAEKRLNDKDSYNIPMDDFFNELDANVQD